MESGTYLIAVASLMNGRIASLDCTRTCSLGHAPCLSLVVFSHLSMGWFKALREHLLETMSGSNHNLFGFPADLPTNSRHFLSNWSFDRSRDAAEVGTARAWCFLMHGGHAKWLQHSIHRWVWLTIFTNIKHQNGRLHTNNDPNLWVAQRLEPAASGELWGTIWGNFRFSDGVPSTCCPSFGTSGSSEVFPRPHFTMRGVILGQTNFPDLWGFYSSRTKEGFDVNPGLGGYSPNSHNLILKWYPPN